MLSDAPRSAFLRIGLMAWCLVVAPFAAAADPGFTREVSFTTSEGTRMNPDVSPDGSSIVFDLLGDLHVVGIEGGTARALLTGPAVEYRPRYSPDGTRIAFVSDRNGTDNLWVMNADGSGAQMLSAQSATQRPKDTRFFITPAWTPDGKAVCAAVTSELTFYGADDIRCFELGAAGSSTSVTEPPALDPATRPIGTARRLAFPREGVDPEFSRDGRYLYYSVRTNLTRFNDDKLMPQYQLGQFDRLTRQLHTLTGWPQGAFTPRLSPDGRWLIYAVRYDADTALRLRDLRTGKEKWLVFPLDRDAIENWWTEGLVNAYSFLPDSASIITSFEGKLWRVGVPDGKLIPVPFRADVKASLAPLRRARQLIKDDEPVQVRHISDISLSPDGRQLAFRALGRVWIKPFPDGVPRRVTRDEDGFDDEARPTWSLDGRSLLFSGTSTRTREGHIHEYPLGTGSAPRKLTRAAGYYASLAISPDNESIVALHAPMTRDAFFSGLRQANLVRLPRAGGDSTTVAPLSFEGGSSLEGRTAPDLQFIRRDPRHVFFFDNDASMLVSVNLDTGARREHLHVGGLNALTGTGRNSGVAVRRAVLHPEGLALLLHDNATAFGQIDWIDLSDLVFDSGQPPRPVTISAIGAAASTGVKRLSTVMGGYSPFWSTRQDDVYFAMADELFRVSLQNARAPQSAGRIGLRLPRKAGAESIVFRGARLLTMQRGGVIESGDIVVTGARITTLGPTGKVALPRNARVIDATGLTIMPGLISTHSHNSEVGEIGPLPALAWSVHAKLAYGVTTMLDPASPMELYTLADLENAGSFAGPRTFMTGPVMTWDERLASPDDARELVRRSALYRDCCAKIYDIGGRLNRQWTWPALNAAGLLPIPETEGSLNASLSFVLDGVSHLAHGLQMPVYEDVRQLFARSGVSIGYQFNTLVGNGGPSTSFYYLNHTAPEDDPRARQWIPYEYFQSVNRRRLTVPDVEHVFRMYGENLARMMDHGTPIHLGEHGVVPGLANHWTLWALANGAGNQRALEAATIHGAYAMGMEQDLGSLEAGKLADLVVLDRNPLEDIRATVTVRYVMRGGELFDPMTLQRVWPSARPGPVRWWADDSPEWRPGTRPAGGVNP